MRWKREPRSKLEKPRVERQVRGQWARVTTLVSVVALAFALVKIQVFTSDRFARIAKQNRLRPIMVRAPRGTIYDRHGRVVAENAVGYRVLLMPAPMDSMRAAVERLRPVLGLTDRDIRRAFRQYERDGNLPMEVLPDASRRQVARLQERRYEFRGVLVHAYPKRRYPAGSSVGHIVGYVAEITEDQLEQPEFRNYRQGQWIGQAGLEAYYEQHLGGEPGMRYLEVDALGHIKRWLPEEMGVPPIPGRDIQLHLDLDLQRYVAEVLFPQIREQLGMPDMQAALVAVDPKTGGVLALHSTPGFDPNAFVGGVDPEVWKRLSSDPDNPLLDRATGAAQPPGSTFKLTTAAMALRLDAIDPDAYMPIPCSGGMRYQGRYARCWGVHGYQDLSGGIKHSCDVYFYQVGIAIGFERFLEVGTRLGLAKRTGVDLPNEIPSIFPKGPGWWERKFGYKPNENEIMSLSIGQGAVTLTPLKLAQLFVPLARPDGVAPPLRLARGPASETVALDYGISREEIRLLRNGMRRVLEPGGTAHLSRLPYWDFMGKTGTAENPRGPDHAWFVGVGGPKGEESEIVVSMMIMHGLHGYVASGPVANAINFYLNRKHGRPFERYPTPRERLPRGLHVDWEWLQSPVDTP